ncbi:MAG: cytochrome c [Acidobacteriia bacterium]|nr:cytochrome c [Terriglobia bacterium]
MKFRWLASVLLLALFSCPRALAQQPADFFQQNCTSCHTIGGGRVTGPDLKDVTKQKDRAWIEHFIQNPKAVLDGGDPFALQLQQDARGVVMPTIPGLTPQMAKGLLDLIEAESKLAKSRFAGVSISDRPFTAADIAMGTEIFTGSRKLSQGGPPCISCHTLGTLGGLGGGRLGPDLTRVYERLGGRKAAGSWLSAPATPTMQAVFRRHPLQSEEILPLLSVFEDASRRSQPADAGTQLYFFMAGIAGASLGLLLMGWVWRNRMQAVRRTLVSAAQRGAE